MKKLIAVFISSLIAITSPVNADVFYSNKAEPWEIVGETNRGEIHTSCFYRIGWNDGSEFRVIFDLVDGEMYILFKNNQWNISDEPGVYNLQMNFHSGDKIAGFKGEYELLSKNTIRIRKVNGNLFMPNFMHADEVRFVMPGNIANAKVTLRNTKAVSQYMLECLEDAEAVLGKKNRRGNSNKPSTDS